MRPLSGRPIGSVNVRLWAHCCLIQHQALGLQQEQEGRSTGCRLAWRRRSARLTGRVEALSSTRCSSKPEGRRDPIFGGCCISHLEHCRPDNMVSTAMFQAHRLACAFALHTLCHRKARVGVQKGALQSARAGAEQRTIPFVGHLHLSEPPRLHQLRAYLVVLVAESREINASTRGRAPSRAVSRR